MRQQADPLDVVRLGMQVVIDDKLAEIQTRPKSQERDDTLAMFQAMRLECEAVIGMAERYADLRREHGEIIFRGPEYQPLPSGLKPGQLGLDAGLGRIDITRPGWHRIKLTRPFGELTLNLWIGEALEMVHALTDPCDAWFLDGFAPSPIRSTRPICT